MFKKALSALRSVPKPAANLAPPARPAAIGPRELVWAGGVSLIAGGGLLYLSKNKPALRLDTASPLALETEIADPPSQFLFATGGVKRASQLPVYTRDDATIIVVIGTPKAGKSEQAKRISDAFSMTLENENSDLYSNLALAIPTAHLTSPTGSSKVRVVVDNPFLTDDPLAEALAFETNVSPIFVFVFVDCPEKEAFARVTDGQSEVSLQAEHAEFTKRFAPLIKHYRNRGNFIEITGQWPQNEQWEQVYAKVESVLELEARGEVL